MKQQQTTGRQKTQQTTATTVNHARKTNGIELTDSALYHTKTILI